ncbi:MAG TPA: hypothetical protein P5065_06860 [Candidatus Ratteibacteria bacterium]|nr:hypothetical protein [bacterium]HOQ81963.1 hypothetical protein [bacterium]HPC30222.1 hypothetical protein [bacterium]HRS06742.1 hypothetical protein [Candidatus Ratteibacteria bacterium]HRV04829.1 hypothetical protein [Candidatus Ratteibacteria bacterium]
MNKKKNITNLFCLMIFSFFVCLNTFAAGSLNFSLKIVNIPFPPYQRNITKLVNTGNGTIYGIIPENPFSKGDILLIDGTDNIVRINKFSNDTLQVDSVIFNQNITWTWDKTLTKIITLDAFGVLKVYEKDGTEKEIGMISGTRPYEKNGYQISRAFAVDNEGNLYTAGKDGFLFRYNPQTRKLDKLNLQLPAVKGREAWATLDAAAISEDGKIYLGTFDGYIVEFNPISETMINLGKPLRQQRIQALACVDNIIFGIGGEHDGLPRWFIYNPSTRNFEIGGTLKTQDNKLILEPVNTLLVTSGNKIYGSFSGRLGNLFLIEITERKK